MWVYVCLAWAAFGRCLPGLDDVKRAAEGPVLRDRRLSCSWRGAVFDGCLQGLDVVAPAAGGPVFA